VKPAVTVPPAASPGSPDSKRIERSEFIPAAGTQRETAVPADRPVSPPIGPGPEGSAPKAALAPVDATPEVVTPPLRAIVVPTAPVHTGPTSVESWDEVSYVCKAEDTFKSLSAHYYQTEDYALALQLYNRNHPRASETLRRDGTLTIGETIYIPSGSVLEQRHGSVIPKTRTAPAPK
jgi:hypothetical protein